MSDRERYSSVEERLVAIKTLCKGHGDVKVNYDYTVSKWSAITPAKLPDGNQAMALGNNPGDAIDNLWAMLVTDYVTFSYPNMQDQQFKWDGMRWVDYHPAETV